MPIVEWDPATHSVNIQEIDGQHQKLFACLNDLYDAMIAGQGKAVIGKVLDDLLNYTVYHFDYEDQLFSQHGYPDAVSHRAEHAQLTEHARALKERFDAGQLLVTTETLSFLLGWLNNHILITDKLYVPFLNAKGVR
jgi:hemerythrin